MLGAVFGVVVVASSTVTPRAYAQATGEEATRVSARALGEEGTRLFETGDYAGALDKFKRAFALVPRQTLGLRVARCLAKLGRLNEAYERYVAVARMPITAGLEPDVVVLQNEAKAAAEAEGAALSPRIPSLVIDVKGTTEAISVTIDGAEVPAALLGVKRAVDPGSHVVVATSAGKRLSRTVIVKEGETTPLVLTFDASAPAAPPDASGPVPAPPPPAAPPIVHSSAQRNAGIALLVVGGAGVIVGAAVGGAAVAKKGDLTTTCGASLNCPKASWPDADAYNTLRTVSSAGLFAGAGVAAVGLVVLLTAPKSTAAPATGAAVWFGPGRIGVRGSF